MDRTEFETYRQRASDVVGRDERELRRIMRIAYRVLIRQLRDSPGNLPKGILRDGKHEIIVFTGNPHEAATVLVENGNFEGRRYGISRQPNQFDLPFTKVRYIKTALEVLDKLAGM